MEYVKTTICENNLGRKEIPSDQLSFELGCIKDFFSDYIKRAQFFHDYFLVKGIKMQGYQEGLPLMSGLCELALRTLSRGQSILRIVEVPEIPVNGKHQFHLAREHSFPFLLRQAEKILRASRARK
jgi:hypothetical protein